MRLRALAIATESTPLIDTQPEAALPATQAPELTAALAQTLPTIPRRPCVLVIDDEARVRTLLSLGLRQHGFDVRVAAGGLEALEVYRACHRQFDIVLLDVLMPDVDGPQTFQALRETNPAILCCFLAGASTYADDELRKLGPTRIFSKPVNTAELVQSLWLMVANVEDTPPPLPAKRWPQPLLGPAPETERRAYVRYLCQLEGLCHPLGQPAAGTRWQSMLRDVGSGGVRLHVARRFEVGTLLTLELPSPDDESTQLLLTRVAHVNSEEGGLWALGCAFTNPLSDDDLRALFR